jgi:hypothetical protein
VGSGRFCNPKAKRVPGTSRKPKHADESDVALPEKIRGKHFNACFQICKRLGCTQGTKAPQLEMFENED